MLCEKCRLQEAIFNLQYKGIHLCKECLEEEIENEE